MKSYGLLYGGKLQYWHRKVLPIIEVGTTQETEMPYRKGKCLVFRAPFTHPGFYLGVWVKRPDIDWEDDDKIDKLLSEAMKGRNAWTPKDGLFDETF
jgi:hypothetical protein